jgi:hypothetical protein
LWISDGSFDGSGRLLCQNSHGKQSEADDSDEPYYGFHLESFLEGMRHASFAKHLVDPTLGLFSYPVGLQGDVACEFAISMPTEIVRAEPCIYRV